MTANVVISNVTHSGRYELGDRKADTNFAGVEYQFNSRETYLAFVGSWKHHYHVRSAQIRALKQLIKTENRKPADQRQSTYKIYANLRAAKLEVTALINLRHSAKLAAQQQYLAAKKLALAA